MVELHQDVLDACHGLAACGLGSGIGGHVSIRVPGRDLYWTNALDRSFEEITLDDLFLLDFDGRPINCNRQISPGIDFHQGIYKLRPDVNAIVHTHGFWITAQSAFNRPPKMWHNLSTYFYGATAVSPDDSIEAIAPELKENVAIVIPWHGAITVGKSIGEAVALHVTFDYACRLDVTMAPTGAQPLPDEACRRINALVRTANYLDHTWDLVRRKGQRTWDGEVIHPSLAA
ncbi:MAG: class II aldolase/adducin family protein [Zymomonas sp.]|nr:MAG: class II aldolase/adducin family protein [Zymomonas sp.]